VKVLQISTHLNIGGIGSYIVSLSAALKRKGLEAIVASSGGNLEAELQKIPVGHKHIPIDTKFELSLKVFISALRLSKIIKEEKIDIIHAHSRVSQVAALFASRMTGVPFVTTCHGYFKKRARGIFDTWGSNVIAISDAVLWHLVNDLGVKKDRIALIYNGVDAEKFSQRPAEDELVNAKKALGLKGGPVIGTIGRLSPVKGHRFFVGAMRDIISKRPDAQGLIVGSGEEELSLRQLTGSLNISDSIIFVPSAPDTSKFLYLMDIFVFPSVKEGLGLALLEALACARPCVASRIGGIEDIIRKRHNGILVEPEDPGAIAAGVLSLLDDPSAATLMGERGRAVVSERFSLDIMADNTMALYRKVLKR
jgi:glycosyltransferase involved in cell wall biosynthesis